MIVWRGYGILVLALAGVALFFTEFVAEAIWSAPLSHEHKTLARTLAMVLAAGLVFGLQVLLDRHAPGRTLVDQATGEQVQLKPKHDLFFVPVKFWPYLLLALGVATFFLT